MHHYQDRLGTNIGKALKKEWLRFSQVVFSADNGGIGLGNNHPLRGHKHDPYEGGTRATAFISGGFVPVALRGSSSGDLFVHVADWYSDNHSASLASVSADSLLDVRNRSSAMPRQARDNNT